VYEAAHLIKCVGLILSFSTPYLKTVVEIISVAHRRLSHVTNILLIAHKTAAGGTEEDFKQNWNVSTDITKILNFIQIHLLRVTLVHADGQTDRDRHDEGRSHFLQFCECTKQ
jgi:hypothetical protein